MHGASQCVAVACAGRGGRNKQGCTRRAPSLSCSSAACCTRASLTQLPSPLSAASSRASWLLPQMPPR
eukprot:770064-Prymnesium_polylepis.1